MRITIDIDENNYKRLLADLKKLRYLESKHIIDSDELLIEELRTAFEEINEFKNGSKKLQTADEFLNEL